MMPAKPLVSIITVSLNSSNTIARTIRSVLDQTYDSIEYIVVDGKSTDGTPEILNSFGSEISCVISEPDNGMYDAINKGIRKATGAIVGILNSDDYFAADDTVETIVSYFSSTNTDAVYADVRIVDPENTSKTVRYYSSSHFAAWKFRFGFMPAHPGFFVKKDIYELLGLYRTDFKIAADFELMLRFIYRHKINCVYINKPLVTMCAGGLSNKSVASRVLLNSEIRRACRDHGLATNYLFIYSKYLVKIFEYIKPGAES